MFAESDVAHRLVVIGLTQVFAEAAMFGAVGIGNCDKLFPKMLFPTTCAKSLAEALLHVRRMEEDPTQWTQASQYVNKIKSNQIMDASAYIGSRGQFAV